jgi:hypothetical protein
MSRVDEGRQGRHEDEVYAVAGTQTRAILEETTLEGSSQVRQTTNPVRSGQGTDLVRERV